MFNKILIANRGEIACRIIRTAKQLGVRCVAIYSEVDNRALHVKLADEAYRVGPAPSRESYLKGDAIIEIAKKAGCDAIHPGYGFLSDNAGFAQACEKAGIVFIGPPVGAIRSMGSKSAAKEIMTDANVPLVPGYHGDDQTAKALKSAANDIGYPVLLKASAGGGGKGMRIVRKAGEFSEALTSAKREAKASFGDDHMLVEKYLEKPRHIEFQVFADMHGNVLHLFERDCSIQRRYQKIIEEAPAPGMTPLLREKMGQAAVKAARAINYVGAGTVEFLLADNDQFYFMEMNTRLQVEHPVTEMITGQDLVAWQLKIASGEELPCDQSGLAIHGHAIETRLYAEDPQQGFLPAIGKISYLRLPESSKHVRIDTGVQQGDAISIHYDPMIAKLIVWDTDRHKAVRRLQQALSAYHIGGLVTNRSFLLNLAKFAPFNEPPTHTHFLEEHEAALIPAPATPPDFIFALAALYHILSRQQQNLQQAETHTDPYSPWHATSGWRLGASHETTLRFLPTKQVPDEEETALTVGFEKKGFSIALPQARFEAQATLKSSDIVTAFLNGQSYEATVICDRNQFAVFYHGQQYELTLHDPALETQGAVATEAGLTAPMPGTIIKHLVTLNEKVEAGAPLMVMEAMKMEHTLYAPSNGQVSAWHYQEGDQVTQGVPLLDFSSEDSEADE